LYVQFFSPSILYYYLLFIYSFTLTYPHFYFPFNYPDGPVLTPILLSILSTPSHPIKIQINPLLLPPPDDPSTHPFLKWNMLFPPGHIARSDDPDPRMSWTKGRDAPATWPRVSQIKLVCEKVPGGLIVVDAGRSGHGAYGYTHPGAGGAGGGGGEGVTCGDVIEAIHDSLMRPSGQSEFYASPPEVQRAVGHAYTRNRSRENGVPGGRLGEGMRRLDWLLQETVFAGIVQNERLVRRVCGSSSGGAGYGGGVMSCVFELRTERRWPMTQREIEEQRARDAREEQRERAASAGPSGGGGASPSMPSRTPSAGAGGGGSGSGPGGSGGGGAGGEARRRTNRPRSGVSSAWVETVVDAGD
jgi:hypothetical protein